MFKNKAIYIEAVEKKSTPPNIIMPPNMPDERQIEDIVNNIISESGFQMVKGIVIVMGAYFAFKTISIAVDNLTDPDRKE